MPLSTIRSGAWYFPQRFSLLRPYSLSFATPAAQRLFSGGTSGENTFHYIPTGKQAPLVLKPNVPASKNNALFQPKRCSFHSTAVREASREWRLIDFTKEKPVNFQEIEKLLAVIDKDTNMELKEKTFFLMAKNCASMKDALSAELAERLIFDWMMHFYEEGRLDKHPQPNVFGVVFQAWVYSGHPSSGKRAEQLIDRMEDLFSKGALVFEVPNVIFNMVMKAYASHGDVKNVRAVFDRCRSEFDEGNESARPNVVIWTTLLDAYGRSGQPYAWKMAENIFGEMQRSYEEGLLEEPPNTMTYNSVICACAKSKQPQRAEFWMREMHKDYMNGNTSAKPNEWGFNALMESWAHSGTQEGAQQSEKVLNDMVVLGVKPDTVSYNTVMMAYARARLPIKAEDVFKRQYDDFMSGNTRAQIDAQGLNAIIHGWARARESNSGVRAETVLDHMEELYKKGVLKERPDAYTYVPIIKSWAVLKEPTQARRVFDRMLLDFQRGNNKARPTLQSFHALFHAYTHAQLPDAGELADEVLEKMKELQVTPTAGTFVAVIRCWECSVDPTKRKTRLSELSALLEKASM